MDDAVQQSDGKRSSAYAVETHKVLPQGWLHSPQIGHTSARESGRCSSGVWQIVLVVVLGSIYTVYTVYILYIQYIYCIYSIYTGVEYKHKCINSNINNNNNNNNSNNMDSIYFLFISLYINIYVCCE